MGPIEETLRKAKALIDTPEKWTQGEHARTASGHRISCLDKKAVSFCSIGAISRTINEDYCVLDHGSVHFLRKAAGCGIISFNDDNTHPEVMAAWDKAIALAAEEGA